MKEREWGYSFESIAPYPRAQIANNNPSPQSPSHPTPFLLLLLLTIFVFSCATSPKTGIEQADGTPDFAVLPPGAELYLWADAGRAKPILEAVSSIAVSDKDISQILDRTTTALAAFYPETGERRFFLVGYGNYPNLRAGFSMTFSRDWTKIKSATGNRYWYSESNNLGVALGPQLAFASDGDPFSPGQGPRPAPKGFEDFRSPCVLSGWLSNPGASINRLVTRLGLPIQIPAEDFFFGAVQVPADSKAADNNPAGNGPADKNPAGKESWELVFKIRTTSASQARSLLSLFSMARLFVRGGAVPGGNAGDLPLSPQEAAALLFANTPAQDGEYLTLRTGALGTDKVASLLAMLAKR